MERVRKKILKAATVNEGNRQNQRQKSLPKLTSDSTSYSANTTKFTCDLGRSSSSLVTGTPMKMLLAEEMSKETVFKGRPLSVVARLMGLDGLPPEQPVHKQHVGLSEAYGQRTALVASQRNGKPYQCQLNSKNLVQQGEFKDVYEVLETPKDGGRTREKGTINSKLSETEQFIQKEFKDRKCVSTDEKLHWLEKHRTHLQGAPPISEHSHTATIKQSKLEKYESNTIAWMSEQETLTRGTSSDRMHYDGHSSCFFNHHGAQKPFKSSKIRVEGQHGTDTLPTRIVLLKPNLETVQYSGKSVSSPFSPGNLSNCRRHMEYQTVGTGEATPWVQKSSSNDVGFLRPTSRESRHIAKEITLRMRESFHGDQIDLSMSGSDSVVESEVTMLTSRKSFHWNNQLHSVESCVSREAKKRLSERWNMSKNYQDAGGVGKESTLREMLGVPVREMEPENLVPRIGADCSSHSVERFASNEEIVDRVCPLGMSSGVVWKDGCVKNLYRSRSACTSSSGFGSPKASMRCKVYMMPGETINQDSNKAIEGNFNKRKDSSFKNLRCGNTNSHSYTNTTDSLDERQSKQSQVEINLGKKELSNQRSLVSKMPANKATRNNPVTESEVDARNEDTSMSSESPEELLPKSSAFLLGNGSSSTVCPEDSEAQEPQHGPFEEDLVKLQCPVPEPQSPASSKEADHPSPVSVLEVMEDISSSSECFERVSADLHELRKQLSLLKMESGVYADEGMFISSDKDDGQGFCAVSEEEEICEDESWESFYLVDVLIESGFDDADPDMCMSMWHSPECPIGPRIFDNLEKTYHNDTFWLRSVRKLLFDRINSGLLGMFQQLMDSRPWVPVPNKVGPNWQNHGVKHELQMLLASEEKRAKEDVTEKELDREMRWVEFRDGTDLMCMELEKLLIEDLIAEVTNM